MQCACVVSDCVCGLYCSTTFIHKFINDRISEKNDKVHGLILSITLSETFFFLRRIEQDVVNAHRSSCKVPVILVRF